MESIEAFGDCCGNVPGQGEKGGVRIASKDAVGATTRGCPRWGPGWSFSLTGTADRDRRRGWYCMLAQQRWLGRSSRDCHQGSLCGQTSWTGWIEMHRVCKCEQPALAISSLTHTRAPFNLVWQFLRFQLLDDETSHAKISARCLSDEEFDSCQLSSFRASTMPRQPWSGWTWHARLDGIAYISGVVHDPVVSFTDYRSSKPQ